MEMEFHFRIRCFEESEIRGGIWAGDAGIFGYDGACMDHMAEDEEAG